MKTLRTLALITALSAVPVFAQSGGTSVAGNWKVTGDVVGHAIDMVCAFTQDGKKLSGTCKSAGEEKSSEVTGEVDDQKVTWKYDSEYQSQKITVTFKGTLDAAAQLKGDIDVQPFGVNGTFSAAKEEAKKEEPKKP